MKTLLCATSLLAALSTPLLAGGAGNAAAPAIVTASVVSAPGALPAAGAAPSRPAEAEARGAPPRPTAAAPCARKVKVVYAGYGEADRSGCAPAARHGG